tara:strand:+ start:360 stop:746 length:387 start_codon:yes stop_codon:yes gene_type:complete
MNYYREYLGHCRRKVFNYFSRSYCSKWDNLLGSIIDNGDYKIESNYYSSKILTIAFNYEGKVYTVWVGSCGYYAAGSLYRIDGREVKEEQQRRPSFKLQFKLLQMVEDLNNSKLEEDRVKFEKEVYGG